MRSLFSNQWKYRYVSIVKAVGDPISLDKKTAELKDMVEPTKK